MSDVELSIGGRNFRVACAPGEEAHVTGLGRLIASKVETLGLAGQSEGRMLLFASLMLADELHEAAKGNFASPPPPVEDTALAARLESIAAALEKCASALEG